MDNTIESLRSIEKRERLMQIVYDEAWKNGFGAGLFVSTVVVLLLLGVISFFVR